MASIIEGFEYDIFISYRQKDNKGDRWVSEFVSALKTEIESTFKEDISVYFDENPHDGLLETYDVDASLKEKLKCLVFIPVISRTYCDPKSFAWEHEFSAFVEQASHDQFGMKVNLPNGNVTSRVLPVRIHDLDFHDLKLCETMLGGVLRSVDFVFKSTGVNRPLRSNEDYPQNNSNKTYYRDQINKLANAIEDIIKSLKNIESGTIQKISEEKRSSFRKGNRLKEQIGKIVFGQKAWKSVLLWSVILLSLIATYAIYITTDLSAIEKTVAFIPFQVENKDPELIQNGDILMDAIGEKLGIIKKVRLKSRISSIQYRDTKKSISTIRKELNVNYLIAGSIVPETNKTMILIELIKARDNKQIWFQKYPMDKDQIIKLSKEIARGIASGMRIVLSSDEKKRIEISPTKNEEAYQSLIAANGISSDAWLYYNMGNKLLDSTSFNSAIQTYDKAIRKDSLFALAYAKRAIARSWGYSIGQLDYTHIILCKEDIDKALKIDNELNEANIALGFYYYYCKNEYNNALKYFGIAAGNDPENYQPAFLMAMVYRKMGDWENSKKLLNKVIKLNPQESIFLTNIGLSYDYLRSYDSAAIYHQKAIDILPRWSSPYKNLIETIILKNGNISDARIILDTAVSRTGLPLTELNIILNIYDGKYNDALKIAEQWIHNDSKKTGEKYVYLANIYSYLNNTRTAEKYYDSARLVFEKQLIKNPDLAELHSSLGISYAGKGEKEKAVNEGKIAVALSLTNKLDENDVEIDLAKIYTMVGDFENAFKTIEDLLINPSTLSTKLLQVDPVWKPLSERIEFRNMVLKYNNK